MGGLLRPVWPAARADGRKWACQPLSWRLPESFPENALEGSLCGSGCGYYLSASAIKKQSDPAGGGSFCSLAFRRLCFIQCIPYIHTEAPAPIRHTPIYRRGDTGIFQIIFTELTAFLLLGWIPGFILGNLAVKSLYSRFNTVFSAREWEFPRKRFPSRQQKNCCSVPSAAQTFHVSLWASASCPLSLLHSFTAYHPYFYQKDTPAGRPWSCAGKTAA